MHVASGIRVAALAAASLLCLAGTPAEERRESFDSDPRWEGRNNRSQAIAARPIVQDFGYRATHRAGGLAPGEVGGFITPAAEPAYYAKPLRKRSLAERLSASGTLLASGRQFHILLGFFNAGSLNQWRTPNTIALRLYGRGDVFYAYLEYCTAKCRAGGDDPRPFARTTNDGRRIPIEFAPDVKHAWTLDYDPLGNDGRGVVTATIDDVAAVCHLAPGHRADGAAFDRFGLLTVMKHADTGGEVWLDDLVVDGERESFDRDPGWDARGNRRRYETADVRPRFDFGYSTSRHAGGKRAGEIGGLVFRGDCRDAGRMAYYGDRLQQLNLERPLRAAGRVSLTRGVSDSTTLFGFFHATDSMAVSDSQSSGFPRNFLGIAIEGPSREGFFVYPAYRLSDGEGGWADGNDRPRILPDGRSHDWTLVYSPEAAGGRGEITVGVDGRTVRLELSEGHRATDSSLNRFGFVTTWIDGNGQRVYLDDLTYTWRQ